MEFLHCIVDSVNVTQPKVSKHGIELKKTLLCLRESHLLDFILFVHLLITGINDITVSLASGYLLVCQ